MKGTEQIGTCAAKKPTRRYTWVGFFCGLLMLAGHSTVGMAEPRTYVIGVVPQFEPRRTVEIWQPILDQIYLRTGIKLVLRPSPSIPEFEQQFSDGVFDFAYMNPYHLLVANRKQGYRPILRDVGRELYGIVVVKKDSPLSSVKALDGKKVAFPAPNSLGAALIPRAEFKRKFNIKVQELYVKSHSSVYLNVVLGLTEAGGGIQKTLDRQPKEIRDQLRVLYKTKSVASHPIAVHPRVSRDIRVKLTSAFMELGATVQGRSMLADVPFKRIGTTSMKDYYNLRRMRLEAFYVE